MTDNSKRKQTKEHQCCYDGAEYDTIQELVYHCRTEHVETENRCWKHTETKLIQVYPRSPPSDFMRGKLICQVCHKDEFVKSMGENVISYDSIEKFMEAIKHG